MFDVVQFYAQLSIDVQIFINVIIASYLFIVQLYFCRYLICESCFKEYD